MQLAILDDSCASLSDSVTSLDESSMTASSEAPLSEMQTSIQDSPPSNANSDDSANKKVARSALKAPTAGKCE